MGGKLYCDMGSGKRGFFGESCAAAIKKKTQGVGSEKAWWSSDLGSWERYMY